MSEFGTPPRTDSSYWYGRNAPQPDLEAPISKSWLFEIAERESGKIRESFTLILPPTAYTIKEPQRVSITKTFGNAFVDDYGPDNIQITLKGISGTAHAFPTFKTEGTATDFSDVNLMASDAAAQTASMGYTGRDAFHIFRNKIMRYKNKGGWEKNELRVYDLADEQGYKCVLLNFTLDRSSEQPLRYPFTISLFVYQRLEALVPHLKVIRISKEPVSALNKSDSLLDKIEQLYQGLDDIIDKVSLLKAKSLELRTRYNKFLTQTTKILVSPLDIAKNFVDIAFAALGTAYDTYQAGKYTLERYMGVSELFRATLNEGLKIYGFQISEGWQTSKTITIEGDAGVDAPKDVTEVVSKNMEIRDYEFSGLNIYTVKGDDTLQRIAQNELGDVDLWPYIASVNSDINDNDDLTPGEEIFIPIQIELSEGINKEQFILTEDITRDPYGSDIRIDGDGNLVVRESNDFALISGIENVEQAVDLRLNTAVGSMIKQTAYGIIAQAGFAGTTMAIRYLKLAIRATLIQDPRIETVNNMIVSLGSDVLNISMNIGIVGAEQSLPVSKVM
jgi:LysM repeat protein